jgi:hypothetical protein
MRRYPGHLLEHSGQMHEIPGHEGGVAVWHLVFPRGSLAGCETLGGCPLDLLILAGTRLRGEISETITAG